MSATPVTLNPIQAPIQARTQLTIEQVAAFQSLLESSGLINFPAGYTAQNVAQFFVTVTPSGLGSLAVTLVNTPATGATGSTGATGN